jgi:hypothetical protein
MTRRGTLRHSSPPSAHASRGHGDPDTNAVVRSRMRAKLVSEVCLEIELRLLVKMEVVGV